MQADYWIIGVLLTVAAVLAAITGKLTVPAATTGWVTGMLVFAGMGYTGVGMIAAFFVLGTAATSWKIKEKQNLGLAEKNKGKRTTGQVVANAGVSAILSLLIVVLPEHMHLLRLMVAASLASAAADTLSSEMGNLYGRKFYNITTFKKDIRGLDGVVSLEGTLIGLAGSSVIACIYAAAFGFDVNVLLLVIAGSIGNISDSVLGATLERKKWLGNNAVNFLNTLIGSLAMLLFYYLFEAR